MRIPTPGAPDGGASSAAGGSDPGRDPHQVLRTIRGPLFLYHALILAGAFVLLYGIVRGERTTEIVGGVLVAAGIAIEATVLVWSARLIRLAAGASRNSPSSKAAASEGEAHWLCLRCGGRGTERGTICPRCGNTRVRVYGFVPGARDGSN